jgi:hypothetical protein
MGMRNRHLNSGTWPGYQYCEAFVEGFCKESRGTLYNTMIPRMSNERTTYYIIHQLFLIKTLRLTSPSDNLIN